MLKQLPRTTFRSPKAIPHPWTQSCSTQPSQRQLRCIRTKKTNRHIASSRTPNRSRSINRRLVKKNLLCRSLQKKSMQVPSNNNPNYKVSNTRATAASNT